MVAANLLHHPQVAVRVVELGEGHVALPLRLRARVPHAVADVPHVADLHAATAQLVAEGDDVRDDEVHATVRAGRDAVLHADTEPDRASRTGWGDLHDPDVLADRRVDEQVEPALAGVEGLGAVHVADRDENQFELDVHRESSSVCWNVHVKRRGLAQLIGAAIIGACWTPLPPLCRAAPCSRTRTSSSPTGTTGRATRMRAFRWPSYARPAPRTSRRCCAGRASTTYRWCPAVPAPACPAVPPQWMVAWC